MKIEIKIAVCFFAEIRDGHLCSPNIKKYFNGNDKYDIVVDYYLHTWDHTYLKNHNKYDFTLSSGLHDGTEFVKKENDEFEKLDLKKLKYFIKTYGIKSYKIDNEHEYLNKTNFLHINQWLSLYESFNLFKKKYDLVVASRPDILFSKHNNFLDDYLENKVEIETDTIVGYEEFFFFAKPKNMKKLIEKKLTTETQINSTNMTFKTYDGKQICLQNNFPTILRPESKHLSVINDYDEIYRINSILYT
jgi:hypothetical protein